MLLLGETPRPHVLFDGFADDDPALAAMTALVPTWRVIRGGDISDLRIEDWDVLVSRGSDIDVPAFMHVLAFECQNIGQVEALGETYSLSYAGSQPSPKLQVPDGLPAAVRRLVLQELAPAVSKLPARPYLLRWSPEGLTRAFDLAQRPEHQPFLLDPDGNVVAGSLARKDFRYAGGYCWALPLFPKRPEEWLAAALADWHEKTPDRIPHEPEWRSRPAWASARLRTAHDALAQFDAERALALARLDELEAEHRAAVTREKALAASGIQRLLTAQDSELVEAIADALATIGFVVTSVDESRAPGQPKIEDLRVADPDEPTWTNITEVKGYSGGARIGDFQKLARFAAHFALTTGALPQSRWYAVNQFLGEDPDARRLVLAGSEDDLAIFAEDGGLVIDTRDLFRLVRLVEDAALTAAQARRDLRNSTGRYAVPSVSPSSDTA